MWVLSLKTLHSPQPSSNIRRECLSYLSITTTKYRNQSNLYNKAFNFNLGAHGLKSMDIMMGAQYAGIILKQKLKTNMLK